MADVTLAPSVTLAPLSPTSLREWCDVLSRVSVCLSSCIIRERHDQMTPNFCAHCLWPWLGPPGSIAIHDVLRVLWMTPCFSIMGPVAAWCYHSSFTACSVVHANTLCCKIMVVSCRRRRQGEGANTRWVLRARAAGVKVCNASLPCYSTPMSEIGWSVQSIVISVYVCVSFGSHNSQTTWKKTLQNFYVCFLWP